MEQQHRDLKPGLVGRSETTVQPSNTARAYGSGLVEVFATPAMIALMELAASNSVQPLLPPGFVSVGTEVNIKHIKATGLHKRVWAGTELKSVEGNKLVFSVVAYDESGKIGLGSHTRYIVKEEFFKL
jgi:fluoroacetyl-CoA thioesterase